MGIYLQGSVFPWARADMYLPMRAEFCSSRPSLPGESALLSVSAQALIFRWVRLRYAIRLGSYKTMFNLLLFSFFWSLVEINSQTAPYVSFNGQTLANHSYVHLSLVGDDSSGSDSVQCHTDLNTCCTGAQGVHRGDWYSAGLTDRLPFSNEVGDIFEQRTAQRVDLRRRNSATSPVGIYRCEIPTNAVYNENDNSVRATVYVGLYTTSGGKI